MKIWQRVNEQIVSVFNGSWNGLRTSWKIVGRTFFGATPAYDSTMVNYNMARALYANQDSTKSLGAFFAKPIVDLQVDFIGHPVASTDDETDDDFLNTCLHDYWVSEIQQMFRNAIRDSKTIVRIQQDDVNGNPLMTEVESKYCRLMLVDPERVEIERDPKNDQVITQAVVKHKIEIVEEPGDFPNGVLPKVRVHDILEVITPEDYRYFDTTTHEELTTWNQANTWGFVPFVEVENEYDSTMGGGQSDLETSYALICAFNDVLAQGLQAHKYHSIPKAKFRINDVQAFIKNNFPDVVDSDGKVKSGAEVSWKGKEILFMQSEEDAEFLEARSVLGDTRELLNFLIDCIAIASETPRWAFMIVEAGSANQAENAQTLPWAKKILRKRHHFERPIQDILKMVMKINNMALTRPKLTWEIIRVQDQLLYNQALQMLVMGLEVAAQRKIISDTTYRELLRTFVPNMKPPTQEAKDAEKNFDPQPPPPPGGNGTGDVKNVPVVSGQQGQNE